MTPQETTTLVGAIVAVLTALAGYFGRPKVDQAIARRKARKHVESKADAPVMPPEVK